MFTKPPVSMFITPALVAALFTLPTPMAEAEPGQSANGTVVTSIRMNGRSADAFLLDNATGTNGFLNVSRDEIEDTTALDFSYATPDATDPDLVILIQGAGEIPNAAFSITKSSAQLALTTPNTFLVNRCVVNIVTADYDCTTSYAISFDLTWAKNSLGHIYEKSKRVEIFGPVTTKSKGDYISISATVTGQWDGHATADLSGNLLDTQNTTRIREITVAAGQ